MFEKSREFLLRQKFKLGKRSKYFFFAVYILLVSYIAYHHELWRDEVDVWLFVRDTDLAGYFRYLRNSGHPGLWHTLLLPFAKMHFPNLTIQVIHISIAIASVYLLLFHSKFPDFIKLLLTFNYYFIFEYSVISRNYAIGIFFLFSIAVIYPKRFEHPIYYGILIFFLANTNLYCTILASGISIIYLWEMLESKKLSSEYIAAAFVIILGGVLMILQVFPSSETQSSAPRELKVFNDKAILISTIYSFSPGLAKFDFRVALGFILILLGGIHFFRTKKVLFFYVYSFSLLWGFYTFIYINGYRHAGFILFSFLFSFWIREHFEDNEGLPVKSQKIITIRNIILLLLAISLMQSIQFAWKETRKDIRYVYSNAKEMASFIKKEGLDKTENIFATESADKGKTVLFYLENQKQFYFPVISDYGSHMLWNRTMVEGEKMDVEIALNNSIEKFKDKEKIYFISTTPLSVKASRKLLYQTQERNEFAKDENFYLYLIDLPQGKDL
ncbi:MAG: hypothetical protein IPO06_30265 [Leptospiraceae bacterium]|nr:hypothetical protein [Leptospiraceae bacterium]